MIRRASPYVLACNCTALQCTSWCLLLRLIMPDFAIGLMLLTVGFEGCEPCAQAERKLKSASKELRIKAPNVVLAKVTLISQVSDAAHSELVPLSPEAQGPGTHRIPSHPI